MGFFFTAAYADPLVTPETVRPERQVQVPGARSYSPSLARWTSRDPMEEEGGPDLYCFVINRPLSYVDTDGRFLWPVIIFPPKVPCPDYCYDCPSDKVDQRIRAQQGVIAKIDQLLAAGEDLCCWSKTDSTPNARGSHRSPEAKTDPACVRHCADIYETDRSRFWDACKFFVNPNATWAGMERNRSQKFIRCMERMKRLCGSCSRDRA
jgi:RHS repeat-associated protein